MRWYVHPYSAVNKQITLQVVFKALIVLHQMIRTGSTDQLLQHLSQGDTLRLRNVSGQNWEGYAPPGSMSSYAQYLDARIKAFKDLKHDLVQVQAESNRRSDGLGAGCELQISIGRKRADSQPKRGD